MYLQASIFWKRCRFYPRAVEMGYETKRRRWASFKFQSICTVSKTESSKAEKLKLLNWFIQKHYKLNTLCTISKFLARWSGWDHPQLCKTSRPLSLSLALYRASKLTSPIRLWPTATEREDRSHRMSQTHHNPNLHLTSLGDRPSGKPLREISTVDHGSSPTCHGFSQKIQRLMRRV